MNRNRHYLLSGWRLVAILILAVFAAWWLNPVRGYAEGSHGVNTCRQAVVHTPGAQDCRDHGWTVRRHLLVNARGVVLYSALPHCRFEDGSGQRHACSWNFDDTDGNGVGLKFWEANGRTHYVKAVR